ncbi:type II pantothenate kinase [Cantharellus anzutake]|uniref:type II pantothenate kinase n=1 Tax=Cantharellus anzutake TaxID=1750568 RepID=UPI001906E97F|nr:type II pantothenate kinase [Cantharellus anzutake]XP_038912915.1 type II pantothenate kinase [Cantharellus anzutake]KAF8312184.1 type II pantothenate kinase [Cantharellus anzutake]KAF8326407.1 type II pantothenate kinase [Cantharellus anzutake]
MPGTSGVIPVPRNIQVDTRGAVILQEESPETRDSRGIYLPNHVEPVSHIAVDIGGSLAKIIYFTRSPVPPQSSTEDSLDSESIISSDSIPSTPPDVEDPSTSLSIPARRPKLTGALTPLVLEGPRMTTISQRFVGCGGENKGGAIESAKLRGALLRRQTLQNVPGGSLNFERFETDNIHECVEFIQQLISRSADVNRVSIEEMRKSVKIMATGGGAHRFYDLFSTELGVDVQREDEMECLITGLVFITSIPNEAYFFSDELIAEVSKSNGTHHDLHELQRPSPDPPRYGVTYVKEPNAQLPCLLVNIGSGVSIIKVDEDGKFERVSGTSLGGGTLWGLLSLLTPATSFDEMLTLSETGSNESIDMLVADIYGQDYGRLGLKSSVIASSFGKVFKKGKEKKQFRPEDIAKSLLYAISNNIGQIAYMNAEKYGLERIYFGGCFIRGHAATVATLSYAIRFWSKGTKKAMFLRHEGFLGAIGAWLRNIDEESGSRPEDNFTTSSDRTI